MPGKFDIAWEIPSGKSLKSPRLIVTTGRKFVAMYDAIAFSSLFLIFIQ